MIYEKHDDPEDHSTRSTWVDDIVGSDMVVEKLVKYFGGVFKDLTPHLTLGTIMSHSLCCLPFLTLSCCYRWDGFALV